MSQNPYRTKIIEQPQTKPVEHDQPCPCGCAPCEEPCCELECVERPHFFCGQLLGNDDLNALVEWSRSRFRRRRYLHGWGVVCGLNVRCDPDNPTSVILSEGYAIDCCGEDIVVCDNQALDLSKYCQDETCLDPWRKETTTEMATARVATAEVAAAEMAAGALTTEEPTHVELPDPLSHAAAFDLYLYYDEKGSHPETSLGGCNCGQGTHCEFSRMQETFRWTLKSVSPKEKNPLEQAYASWHTNYICHLDRFLDLIRELQKAQESTDDTEKLVYILCRKLHRWLKQNPLQHFCFVDELLSTCEEDILHDRFLARLLFWMLLDYRLSWLRCDCPRCDPQTGVPVARLWFQIPDYRENRKCRILMVNDWKPFRRPIQPDVCLPSRPDSINLVKFLWQRSEEIESKYDVRFVEFQIPTDINELDGWLEGEKIAELCHDPSLDQPLQLYVVDGPGNNGKYVASMSAFSPG